MAGMGPMGGMMGGMPGGGAPTSAPMQFGPESLMALLMSMFMGGPAQMGPGAGSGTQVGQGSLNAILPQMISMMQSSGGMQGSPGGGAPTSGGKLPIGPGQGPGAPGGQQQGPPTDVLQLISMLQQLGLGGQGGMQRSPAGPIGRPGA